MLLGAGFLFDEPPDGAELFFNQTSDDVLER